jgi:prepilin-type processing-associated H-X9-DG protein
MGLDFELDMHPVVVKPARAGRRRPMSVWTLMKLVFALACSLGLFTWLARAVGDAREAARRSQCLCNLCSIKLALHNYHDQYGTLPPAYIADAQGRPMHSWRVLLLPFMEQSPLYNQYDFGEPWNGPNNIKLVNSMPSVFACPSRFSNPTALTSYVAITGPGTMFPGTGSVKFADVTDGLANTLLIVEVANVNIPWTAPQDLDVRTMSFGVNDPKRPGISSKHPGGANVVFGDASYRFLPEAISPGNLRALITIAGGEGISADEALGLK